MRRKTMVGKELSREKFDTLRKKAEELLSLQGDPSENPFGGDLLKLIHELHTFQIELEIQNEELARTHQALMRSQMLYTDLYDHSPVGYITLDKKGIIQKANLKFAEMLSMERAALIHQRFSQYIAFEDKDICYQHLLNVPDPDKNHSCELHLKRKDGSLMDVQLESIMIAADDGAAELYRIIVSDISYRRKIEAILKYSRLQLEMILNSLDAYIYITDMKTNKILFVNKAMEDLYGKDLIGSLCWQRFQHKTEGPCDFCTNHRLVDAEGNSTGIYVWDFYKQDLNRWFELHDVAIPWIEGGLVRLEIAVDISRRKELEQQQKTVNDLLEDTVKERTALLNEKNIALKAVLNNLEQEKKDMEDAISVNYKLFLSPVIDNLKKAATQKKQEDLIDILESRLNNILSPFLKKLSNPFLNLTSTEIHIAELIRFGKSNKEISELLGSSIGTIARHRENIRKKINLTHKKINLRAFLSSLQ
ncbi:MAG: PAS domain S-box protein [Desulfobacula sp.]|nr:PAS domain S-box protein [Desulfobacula sp.]